MLTGFAHVNGRAVGVVATQPSVLAGCLTAAGARKAARFIRTCDAFNLPIVQFVDSPGFVPSEDEERAGAATGAAALAYAFAEAQVGTITVITRKALGTAYTVLGSKGLGADLVFAWPTAQIAVMGAEAAVVMMKGRELAAMPPEKRPVAKKMFMDFYDETMTAPYVAAERGYLDAMIQPNQSRLALRQALRQLATKQESDLPKKHTIAPM